MHPSTLAAYTVDGPAGRIDTVANDPGPSRSGIALIAHPHPLHGGTRDNKVVQTLAKTFFGLGHVAVRPNFRGVGGTQGGHDGGAGEADDLLAVAADARQRFGNLPLILAGFSFGSYVQTLVAGRLAAAGLVLVGPAVSRFRTGTVPENTLVIHGEHDDVVPLAAVFDWARPQGLPIVVIPGGEHFFHGRLHLLARIIRTHFAGVAAPD